MSSSPFGTEPVEEVFLPQAPLARVVAQIRFPRLAALSVSDDAANAISLALSKEYPLLNETTETAVVITPEGVTQQPGAGRLWHLQDAELAWQVTFGREFVALHTAAYTRRDDFLERLARVTQCFTDVVAPPFSERIGIRYINRLEEPFMAVLAELVRPEVLGGLAVPMQEHGVALAHTLSEALYSMDPTGPGVTDALHARWGLLPSGSVLDPTLPAVDAASWVLDLDSFRMRRGAFETAAISDEVRTLADRAYRFFRWVVTPEFLTRFGADA